MPASSGEGVGLATVYRQLARLVDDGMLGAVEHMGETRYDTNLDPHAHAVCNGCGDIWDVPLPTILASMLTPKRLATVEDVDLTFRGLCPACATIEDVEPLTNGKGDASDPVTKR